MNDSIGGKTTNTNTELAKERSREAAERTLMAWIRTAISMIGFGLGFGAAGEYLSETMSEPSGIHDLKMVGSAFIVLAVISMFGAVVQNVRLRKRLNGEDFRYIEPIPIGLITAILILLFGFLGFVWLTFM